MVQTASNNPARRLLVLAALALAGVGVSIYLTQHYYEVRNGAAGFHSACNLSQTMNCDAVAMSSYAELIPGVPLSSFAAGGFLALFVLSLVARNVFWRRESLRVAFLLSATGLLFSLAYLGVMAGVLHTYCLFCLITDVLAVSIFGVILSLKPEGFATHKPEFAKWKNLTIVSVLAVAVSVLGLRVLDDSELSSSQAAELAQGILAEPVLSVNSGPEFPSIGPANAPVTVVEFSDFQCPFCRRGAFIVNTVLEHYPTQVRVVFRNFPLDASCNRKMEHPLHAYACEAAKTALCAHQQGKFEPVYQTLFENQTTFAPGHISQLAQEAGMDTSRLSTCLASPEIGAAISKDVEEAINLNVESTPTFFLNGHKMAAGALPPIVWTKIIDSLLKQSGPSSSQ